MARNSHRLRENRREDNDKYIDLLGILENRPEVTKNSVSVGLMFSMWSWRKVVEDEKQQSYRDSGAVEFGSTIGLEGRWFEKREKTLFSSLHFSSLGIFHPVQNRTASVFIGVGIAIGIGIDSVRLVLYRFFFDAVTSPAKTA